MDGGLRQAALGQRMVAGPPHYLIRHVAEVGSFEFVAAGRSATSQSGTIVTQKTLAQREILRRRPPGAGHLRRGGLSRDDPSFCQQP